MKFQSVSSFIMEILQDCMPITCKIKDIMSESTISRWIPTRMIDKLSEILEYTIITIVTVAILVFFVIVLVK